MVVLDTNIIIDHLRQPEKKDTLLAQLALEERTRLLALSTVSIQELYEGQSTRNEEAEKFLLATIAPLTILPHTYDVAELAGKIARDLTNPIEFADAAIAATAVVNGAQLFTANIKHFQEIPELMLYQLP